MAGTTKTLFSFPFVGRLTVQVKAAKAGKVLNENIRFYAATKSML